MNAFNLALMCLSLNIYHEARGEPIAGQMAVAYVTLTRAKERNQSVCQVVYHPKQFSWTSDKKARSPPTGRAWSTASRLSLAAYTSHASGTLKTKGATFYHVVGVLPAWTAGKVRVMTIGNHIFYRDVS